MARKKRSQIVDIADIRERIWAIGKQLNDTFVRRSDAIRVMLLAYLSGEHYLLIGEPGTAKTAIAERFALHVRDANWFSAMLGSFTAPEKIFGPLDINAFRDGKYRYVTKGMLPEAHIAFLDEFFKCNEGCLNEMLTLLNERKFNGDSLNLMTVGTATNWPELITRTDNTKALYDRILLRCIVEDLKEEDEVVELLEKVELVESYEPETFITINELDRARESVKRIEISEDMRRVLHSIRKRLSIRKIGGIEKPGIQISSRRLGQLQKVLKAHAWLNNRASVTLQDFECLQWGLWNDHSEYETARSVLTTLDQEIVSQLIAKIDQARQEYRRLKDSGIGPTRANRVMNKMVDTANYVKNSLNDPIFTADGKQSIITAMQSLKSDFTELDATIKELSNTD